MKLKEVRADLVQQVQNRGEDIMKRKIFATVCLSNTLFWIGVSVVAFMIRSVFGLELPMNTLESLSRIGTFGLIMGVVIPIAFVTIRAIVLLYQEIWREEKSEVEENEEV